MRLRIDYPSTEDLSFYKPEKMVYNIEEREKQTENYS